ncbi:AAA family ATPase [Bradyrhizobium sp. NC92]|uniref:AAA family ATPase n=1 Tax=Bradyrhizobium sp. (strain NC92) TaxID=55395 RepID=UPI0021A9F405|nr:AAA family ATPase [Bradyrhizobium sp. NC92]UWU66102.1 AAA family ATPase [Bradyrhizobium sp. NC92]
MRIEFVEIAGFRGFRERTRFELPAGFAVLTGHNGAGKSTVLDAIDFALTGSINKFTVRNARGGGLEDHIWWIGGGQAKEHFVSIGFITDDGKRFTVTRTRRGLIDQGPTGVDLLCGGAGGRVSAETLMKTTLIRDESIVRLSVDQSEQARFEAVREAIGGLVGPDFSARTQEILDAAVNARDEQKRRLDNVQAELGRALSSLTEARSAAEKSPDVAEAMKTLEDMKLSLPSEGGNDALRQIVAERRQRVAELERLISRAFDLKSVLDRVRSTGWDEELKAMERELAAAEERASLAEAGLDAAARALQAERESDTFASHLAALIDHGAHLGLQDGHCPLCDAVRSNDAFEAALAAARTRLAGRDKSLSHATVAMQEAERAFQAERTQIDGLRIDIMGAQQQQADTLKRLQDITTLFETFQFKADPAQPELAQIALLDEQEEIARIERALFILEASGAADRVATWQNRVNGLRSSLDAESTKHGDAERAVSKAREIQTAAKTVANQISAEQFDTVMPLLQELYRRLRPHSEWREIESDFGGKVRGTLNFTVGNGHNVQFLFSSGQRRAAGLAFLLSIHLSRRWCQWQTLLLDDPVQHIDDYRALNLVEVLSAIRRTGRQVVVAVENRALADVLCHKLRSTITQPGRRFDLTMSTSGSGSIAEISDVVPMPREILRPAQAS